jgi:TolB-like protein
MQYDEEALERLFSEALELPLEKRPQFVKEQSGDNLWLQRELETLLRAPQSKVDAAFDSGHGVVRELLHALDSQYMVGRQLGGYRIESLISSGGMGIVYRAVRMSTGEPVALKLLPPEDTGNRQRIRRMAREAEVLEKLNHPGIVRIEEYCELPDCHFLAMELVLGDTLQDRLANGPIPLAQALDWALQIAEAVESAHRQGVVHRDLKPTNIMIERATSKVRLLDFGLARLTDAVAPQNSQTTVDGTVAGTFSYFSPEQANGGRGDERSDIFSFGAVFYEMIAGKQAFRRPSPMATAAAILHESPAPLPSQVPLPVRAVIARCLEKETAKRYAGMRQVAEAIENLHTLQRRGKLKPPGPGKKPIAAALLAVGALAIAGLLAIRPPAGVAKQSIAVLPFSARGSDAESESLSAGLTAEVTQGLGQIPMLRVMAQSSAKQYAGKTIDPQEAGKRLGVQNLLEGKVERDGANFKLTARLERASDGAILWWDTYQSPAPNLAAVQSELAAKVTGSLKLSAAHLGLKHNPKPEAHDSLMKARYEAEQMTPQALRQAEEDLRHAISVDPEYALAYLRLGVAKYNAAIVRGSLPQTDEERSAVLELMHKALELDPDLAAARATLARMTLEYDWDWDAAERILRAVPSGTNSDIEETYAFLRLYQGRFAEADQYMQRSQDRDPFSVASLTNFAAIRTLEGRTMEARQIALTIAEKSPKMLAVRMGLADLDIADGKTDAALQEIKGWRGFAGAPVFEAMAYAKAGQREKALQLIAPLERLSPQPGVTVQWFAMVYGYLGDAANTAKWLNRSADRHEWQVLNMAINPIFKNVRNSPDFQAVERRIGILR